MKIIIENTSKIAAYIFEDTDTIVISNETISTPYFNISGLNSSNATLIEGVTDVPEGWNGGGHYFYKEGAWVLNPDWVDPVLKEIEELESRVADLKAGL